MALMNPTPAMKQLQPRLAEMRRSKAPVFVVGCPRSGTTLLYHMLLSAGGFAVYRTESHAINLLEPRFGDLSVPRNRERLMDAWLHSKLFSVSGLQTDSIKRKVLEECRNGGDFLRIVMEEIAHTQGVERWAECTPEHLLYLHRIKQTIPDALIVHIIRDGRDVALSLEKQNWIRRLPWDRRRPLFAAGVYWDWMVQRGRESGRQLGEDYCEVRFEKLIADPRTTLAGVGGFIQHELNYDRILGNGIGTVSQPNSSFAANTTGEFNPVGRWRNSLTVEALAGLEAMLENSLQELGYPLASSPHAFRSRSHFQRLRNSYHRLFGLKLWFKTQAPCARYLITKDLSWL